MMWDFMFEITGEDSINCGEQFFVECDTLETAWRIAETNWDGEELSYLGKFSVEFAEGLGLDTY